MTFLPQRYFKENYMNHIAYIKLIEELSLNAWPSHKVELYDGWLIRFSHNYTHRTNSVEQIGASLLPTEEKIAYCEQIYKNYHTPSIFKISPLLEPSFDHLLASHGYGIQHTTEVMAMDFSQFQAAPSSVQYEYYEPDSGLTAFCTAPGDVTVQLQDRITDEWISSLFSLNGTTNPAHLHVVPRRTLCNLCRRLLPPTKFCKSHMYHHPPGSPKKGNDACIPSGSPGKQSGKTFVPYARFP